jgi:hypothetical protein
MREADHHRHTSKSSPLRVFLAWATIFTIIILVFFLRYSWSSFFGSPQLLVSENDEDYIEMTSKGFFLLEFDQRMKRKSVLEALEIIPALEYESTWKGKSLTLQPRAPLQIGQVYHLNLRSSAKSMFGKTLQGNYSLDYKVGQNPSIVGIFPDQILIVPEQRLIILFSHPMVSEQELKKDFQLKNIRINPDVPGIWHWRNNKTLIFTPDNGFPLSGKYQLESILPLITLDGTALEDNVDRVFETERLKIYHGDQTTDPCAPNGCAVAEPFFLRFNTSVDLNSLISHASMRDASGKLLKGLNFAQVKNVPHSYTIRNPLGNWRYDERYVLTLNPDLMPNVGNLNLGNNEELIFSTESISPEQKEVAKLQIESFDLDQAVCFHSTTKLLPSSSLRAYGEERQLWQFIGVDSVLKCSKRQGFPFSYVLEKNFLAPNVTVTLEFQPKDIFDQTLLEKIVVKTHSLSFEDFSLSLPQTSFYQYHHPGSEVRISYSTRNVDTVKGELCRLRAHDALNVQTTYEKEWSSFQVNAQNCLQSKFFSESFNPRWGEDEAHELRISDLFDDDLFGIYYLHIFLPKVSDAEGKPLEVGTVLQFTPWDVLSKRGENAFLWLTDQKNNLPVEAAKVELFAHDGSLVRSGLTDENGIFTEDVSNSKYDFILIRNDDSEILLNVFQQEGFEPSRFFVPFNAEDNEYRYHFFIEELGPISNQLRGVFIAQKNGDTGLSPIQQPITLSLSNALEEIFWKKSFAFDASGIITFRIQSPYPLLDGVYQLGACLGKFSGLCEGTNLWSNVLIKNGSLQEFSSVDDLDSPGKFQAKRHLKVKVDHEVEIGESIDVEVEGLVSNMPVLFTAERDDVYFSQVFFPESSNFQLQLSITPEMLPEVIVTVTQFSHEKTAYDMISIPVSRQSRELQISDEIPLSRDISVNGFKLRSTPSSGFESLLEFFYPRLGTSIVTASNRIASFENLDLYPPQSLLSIQYSSDITIVHGDSLTPAEIQLLRDDSGMPSDKNKILQENSYYLIVHDGKGRLKGLTMDRDQPKSDLFISGELPDFLRPDDRLLIPVSIRNDGDDNKNITLLSTGKGLDFLSGDRLMLGLSGREKKLFVQPTHVSSESIFDEIVLDMSLMDNDVVQSIFHAKIPLAKIRYQTGIKKVLMVESQQNQGLIEIPLKRADQYAVRVLASPSPISFVLDNLERFLAREALYFDEEFFKKVAAVQYFYHMQASLESEQEFSSLFDQQQGIGDELYFLESRQKFDGGWSRSEIDDISDPLLTANIARSLALLKQLNVDVPEQMLSNLKNYLKQRLDDYYSNFSEIQKLRGTAFFELLSGLSSLTPSGVVIANNLFQIREQLSTQELVSLLGTFEDYRDANISGVHYKIEELIQYLKTREKRSSDELWLEEDFGLTASYLGVLVRQASARNDIPEIITWLVRHKSEPEYQSLNDQFYFLQAMGNYLQIFRADIKAKELSLEVDQYQAKFSLVETKPFQSFVVNRDISREDDFQEFPQISFQSDQPQSWFIEVNWQPIGRIPHEINRGISVDYELDSSMPVKQGQVLSGYISIVSPKEYERVIVAQPYSATTVEIPSEPLSNNFSIMKSFGKEERWFIIDRLPAGETIIPFHWNLRFSGVFTIPPMKVWLSDHPEILAQSLPLILEVRANH